MTKLLIKITAITILLFSSVRLFANIFFGIIDLKLFIHVFANILWIIAAVGVLKIQNWGRTLMLWLSIFCIFLFIGYLIATLFLFDGHIGIEPKYLQEVTISIVWIIGLNLKHVKEIFLSKR